MKLPRDPVLHSNWPEYCLASHARWAVWAKLARLDGNLESARMYARIARNSLANYYERKEA